MVETRVESEKKPLAEVLFENLLKSTLKNDTYQPVRLTRGAL